VIYIAALYCISQSFLRELDSEAFLKNQSGNP